MILYITELSPAPGKEGLNQHVHIPGQSPTMAHLHKIVLLKLLFSTNFALQHFSANKKNKTKKNFDVTIRILWKLELFVVFFYIYLVKYDCRYLSSYKLGKCQNNKYYTLHKSEKLKHIQTIQNQTLQTAFCLTNTQIMVPNSSCLTKNFVRT